MSSDYLLLPLRAVAVHQISTSAALPAAAAAAASGRAPGTEVSRLLTVVASGVSGASGVTGETATDTVDQVSGLTVILRPSGSACRSSAAPPPHAPTSSKLVPS